MVACKSVNVLFGERAGRIPGRSEVDEADGKLLDCQILIEKFQVLKVLDA